MCMCVRNYVLSCRSFHAVNPEVRMCCVFFGGALVFILHGVCVVKCGEHNISNKAVSEGGIVTLRCDLSAGSNRTSVVWKRDGLPVCESDCAFNNECPCNCARGLHPTYNGGRTSWYCILSSYFITITGATTDDDKIWTCTSGTQSEEINLEVVTEPTSNKSARSPNTRSITPEESSETISMLILSSTDSNSRGSSSTHSVFSTSSPGSVHPESVITDSSLSNSLDRATRKEVYQIYYIVCGAGGGVVIIIAVAIITVKRTRRFKRQKHMRRQVDNDTPRGDEELVMEENEIYWSNLSDNLVQEDNVDGTASSVGDVSSDALKNRGNSAECRDRIAARSTKDHVETPECEYMYAKPSKKDNN